MAYARTVKELEAMRPYGGYRAGLADCPWNFANYSEKGEAKNPNQHYACMSLADIARLPVERLFADDSALLMWGTSPMLDQQIQIMGAWGFRYAAFIPWLKESKNSGAFEIDEQQHKWAFGPGYLYRSAAEILIVGTRGSPRLKDTRRSERNIIVAPVREHSRKPDEQYTKVENVFDGPYIELFSRTGRAGWDHFGNEVGTFGVTA